MRAHVRSARMLDAERMAPNGTMRSRALLPTTFAVPFNRLHGAKLLVARCGESEGSPAMPIVLFALGTGVSPLFASLVF